MTKMVSAIIHVKPTFQRKNVSNSAGRKVGISKGKVGAVRRTKTHGRLRGRKMNRHPGRPRKTSYSRAGVLRRGMGKKGIGRPKSGTSRKPYRRGPIKRGSSGSGGRVLFRARRKGFGFSRRPRASISGNNSSRSANSSDNYNTQGEEETSEKTITSLWRTYSCVIM